jgi:hypothetical protein
MKHLLAFFCASATVASALADPYSMAIQRAKDVSNENSQEQKAIAAQAAPSPQTPSAPQNTPAPNPVLAATLQNITDLQVDLSVLKSDATQKQRLAAHLTAAAQGKQPSKDSVAKLAQDLTTSMAGKNFSGEQQRTLAQSLHAICNSSHLSAAQRQAVFDNIQKTLLAGGVPAESATKVVNDIKIIASETQ